VLGLRGGGTLQMATLWPPLYLVVVIGARAQSGQDAGDGGTASFSEILNHVTLQLNSLNDFAP